ncbi:hypothetical protein WME76_01240 [Sorangium sp. So ce119]|uniref:hypothetical protein n=1 Tax=Sorangium sp. So ce119 TaxID=3133279 RepID=UPI003F61A214
MFRRVTEISAPRPAPPANAGASTRTAQTPSAMTSAERVSTSPRGSTRPLSQKGPSTAQVSGVSEVTSKSSVLASLHSRSPADESPEITGITRFPVRP